MKEINRERIYRVLLFVGFGGVAFGTFVLASKLEGRPVTILQELGGDLGITSDGPAKQPVKPNKIAEVEIETGDR